jgi:pyruvate/2-oxoglutarate dehydrogenase complex dihydrolipoamide dehydrogenase (E3) component
MKNYDLCVIGAGSGGLVAATTGNRLGLKTVLLEKNKIGGECTHSGCIPSKALIAAAKAYQTSKDAPRYGLPAYAPAAPLDFAKVMAHVNSVVQGVYANETPDVFENMGIDVIVDSSGVKFIGPHTVQIGNETIVANNFVICTGSSPRPYCPDGGDLQDFLHNENFWDLRKQPKSITFIGGGVISVELGQAMRRLGTAVNIIDHNPRILKAVDSDVAAILTAHLQEEGIKLYEGAEVQNCRIETGQTTLTLNTPTGIQELTSEAIFIAVGRVPNTGGLDLEKAGIEHTPRGITTDCFLRTSASHIYSCGDVSSPAKFTHAASYQADVCIANILKENSKESDLRAFPWAIFTEPEIAHVGISEAQAVKESIPHTVLKVNATLDRFVAEGKTTGLLKVIISADDLIIGADAIGPHAGEWIHPLAMAARQRLPLQSFIDTVFAYPTYSEIVKKAFVRHLRSRP